jgi:hypothetical protein
VNELTHLPRTLSERYSTLQGDTSALPCSPVNLAGRARAYLGVQTEPAAVAAAVRKGMSCHGTRLRAASLWMHPCVCMVPSVQRQRPLLARQPGRKL